MTKKKMPLKRIISLVAICSALGACSAVDRVKNIGEAPELAPVGQPPAPDQKTYEQVQLPMPRAQRVVYEPNSLWRSGARQFFEDQRASSIGDILTVNIDINDEGSVSNATARSRSSAEDSDLTNFLGFEGSLARVLPDTFSPSAVVSLGSNGTSSGQGTVDRSEEIRLSVAAIVTQVLPNGNLVIQGRQEVRVNFEVRELLITGVVRPEDITATNTIGHTQIAEARISYGGRGQITDLQQPRYGQQLYDIIFPF